MSCHVPNSLGEEAARAKKSLFKEIQKGRHTHAHTPDVNLSNVQRKAREARAVMHVKHICLDIKRSPAIGFTGKVICATQTFAAAAAEF